MVYDITTGCSTKGMLTAVAPFIQSREKRVNKIEQSGMSEEQLIQLQQELFKSAGEKYNAG